MVKKVNKKTLGRQKIEIKKIQNEVARQLCFSTRRNGLFKKASEISILCGVEVATVFFSPAGKPFSFGHPSVDVVTDRFFDGKPSKLAMESSASSLTAARINRDLNDRLTNLSTMMERERQRKAIMEKELKRSEEKISMLKLMEYERRLLELKGEVGKWVDKRVMWSKYGVMGESHVGNVGGVMHQLMPVKNDMVVNELAVREYLGNSKVVSDNNGYFLNYESFGGGGGMVGFGNNCFFSGFH